ncbi:restriction endonuclease subunit S [Pseudomonas sp. FME51]|uniref:restriction endonuclease subunit S n=1 Tax=Pseudomonas sp. FME51 TaxID=2742609 RepID=UPI001865E9B1|nr:restriction endonuclease subunit S [Pseudomonas sp. FME51]
MIPNGWKLGYPTELVSLFSGFAFKSTDAVDAGVRWLKIANVGIGEVKWDNESHLPEHFQEYYNKFYLQVGDIVVAMTRPTLGNHLKIAKIKNKEDEALLNQRVAKLVIKKGNDSEFVYQVFRTENIAARINSALLGTDPPNLSVSVLRDFTVPIPPLPEQKKIAQILSTWDQAITATERLLENSQQRKKGLMQQLLTGKKRLPGFEGEWKKVELGEALAYQQPTPFLVTSTEYSDDFPTPVLTAGKSFLLGYTDETFGIYDDGLPVIIFDDFTTASQFVDFPFKAKSSAMKILTAKPGYSIRFIFEAMRMIRFAVGGHQRHWISIFANLVIPCPSSEEQHAISEVCATADREISSLQARLDSLKSEKKALMQQLLTGKRRVQVDTEVA